MGQETERVAGLINEDRMETAQAYALLHILENIELVNINLSKLEDAIVALYNYLDGIEQKLNRI